MQGHCHRCALQLPSWIHAAAGWEDVQRSAHGLCWHSPAWPQKAHIVLQLGPANRAGGQMNGNSWQPQEWLSEMSRRGRVPSRVLWHTCGVRGQGAPDARDSACSLRTNKSHNRPLWVFSSRKGGMAFPTLESVGIPNPWP